MKYVLHFALILIIISSCSSPKRDRPREAWAVRSVLDQQPRILSIALNDRLWVAYNTQTAGLFKAWTGGIRFDGPVYTSAHGPQPTTEGTMFIGEVAGSPWLIDVDGKEAEPEVVYKGHVIDSDQAITINYELRSGDDVVSVAESPEFVGVSDGKVALQRKFKISGLPSGTALKLSTHIGSVVDMEKDFKATVPVTRGTSSAQKVGDKTFYASIATLTFGNGEEEMTIHFTQRPKEDKVSPTLNGEEAIQGIMAKSDCNTCHNKDVKTVGPAYIEIAKRYGNSPEKVEELVGKVIAGGAGSWGDVPMTAHPNLSREDAIAMVSYILALDASDEKEMEDSELMPKPSFEIKFEPLSRSEASNEMPGILLHAYQFQEPVADFPAINDEMLPTFSGFANAIHVTEDGFGPFNENFVVHASGYITVKQTTNVVFRLVSDDGSRLFIDKKLIVDNGGNHGLDPRDGEMILKAGKHLFLVEYFQGAGGKGLSLQWRKHDAKEFTVVPPDVFSFNTSDVKKTQEQPAVLARGKIEPGDGAPLTDVHPSFDLAQARPANFQPKVGGIDFLPDGRMVVTTWDSLGSVFLLDGVAGSDPNAIKVKRIAFGLAEPLGVKVVDNEIYVLQKQELTRLKDLDGDDVIDQYETVCNGWRVSANFHEFAFGLLYKDGFFYGTLATAINPGGASTKPQIPDRGKAVKISRKDGSFSFVASGLRTPNGIGFGVDQEIFIADNQGDWLPASKIIHLQEGAWYGSRSVDYEGTADATETLPVVWLPQDEIGNSPSQPALLNVGPYKNQMIHGEVTHGGIKRVFAEKVNGKYQGAVFRFTQGLEAGVNRIVWGPDSALYIGGIGSTGNWGHYGKLSYGLQKIKYNNKVTFEMLAVRALPDGIEIEFTEALADGVGTRSSDYNIQQWYYLPTENYGGPKLDLKSLTIGSVNLSDDRKKVKLTLSGMKAKHVVYVKLNKATMTSQSGNRLWSTEAWYTMNNIPSLSVP